MKLTEELERRQWFGIRPGLESMRLACAAANHPERRLRNIVHIAGTNGKGAVCAMLDECLRAAGHSVARYTSPHLVSINERFHLNGAPVTDAALDQVVTNLNLFSNLSNLTYFEYLTLVAFELYAAADPDYTILETGLGGRLDATNICKPRLCVITRIGLDHCALLGDTVEQIAAEKAGIIKPGVPVVLGRNLDSVRVVVESRAREIGAPFFYAPDLATEADIPSGFALGGSFNRENAVTAIAALRLLKAGSIDGLKSVVWPGRFQRVGEVLVDGAHNPPAARALVAALRDAGVEEKSLTLVCGFCGDKEVDEVLRILAPFVREARSVRTNNPRSLSAADLARKLEAAGLPAKAYPSLTAALRLERTGSVPSALVCGSLFLAGEALVELGVLSREDSRFDAAERL